jgi:hypothetical protein
MFFLPILDLTNHYLGLPSSPFKVEQNDFLSNGMNLLQANELSQPIAPRGWKIEPSEVSLTIDGKNDDCSKNVDINFEFIGFGITGNIKRILLALCWWVPLK